MVVRHAIDVDSRAERRGNVAVTQQQRGRGRYPVALLRHTTMITSQSENETNRKRSRRSRCGAAAVETALVLPLALLFLFGIIEYSRFVMTLQVVTNAAREGARYAVTHIEPIVIDGTTYGNGTGNVTNVVN